MNSQNKSKATLNAGKLIQLLSAPAFILNAQKQIIAVNQATLGLLNKEESELIGKKCYTFFHRKKTPLNCPFEKLLTSKKPESQEIELEAINRTFLVTCSPVLDEKGQLESFLQAATDITPAKEAEKKLKEAQKRYQKLFETANDAIFIADAETGFIIDANKKAEKLLGIPRKEIIGMHQSQLHPPEEASRYRKIFEAHTRKKGATAVKGVYVKRRDGCLVPVEIRASTIKIGNKKIIQGLFRDITEQKVARDKIDHLNKTLMAIRNVNQLITREQNPKRLIQKACKLLIETGAFKHVWILCFDENQRLQMASQGGIGKDFDKLKKQLKKGKLNYCTQRALREKGVMTLEALLSKCQDCPLTPKNFCAQAIAYQLAKRGKTYGLIFATLPPDIPPDQERQHLLKEVGDDLTFALKSLEEEKVHQELQEELIENEEKYRSIVEHSHAGILIVGGDYKFEYVNDKLCQILGYSKKEILGHDFRDFLDEPSKKLVADRYRRRQRGEKVPPRYEFNVVRKDGEKRRVEISSTIIKDSKGKVKTVAQILDITDKKKAEEALKKRLSMEELLAHVVEELIKTKNVELSIKKILASLGESFNADRAFILQKRYKKEFFDFISEWHKEGLTPLVTQTKPVAVSKFPFWKELTESARPIVVSDARQFSSLTKTVLKNLKIKAPKSFIAVPIFHKNKLVGTVGLFSSKKVTSWDSVDVNILQAVGETIIISLLKDRYQKKLSQTIKELVRERHRVNELAKRSIEAAEKERLYLASEIHDDLLQGLVATLYFLQMLDLSSLEKKLQQRKEKLLATLTATIDKGRRLIRKMEPIRESEVGLPQAIQNTLKFIFEGREVKTRFICSKKLPKISFALKANLFRIIQEALTNISKHAQATEVLVKLTFSQPKSQLRLVVQDNGIGFDESAIAKKVGHWGLHSMKERANLFDGELNIESLPGQGTKVRGVFPIKGGQNGK